MTSLDPVLDKDGVRLTVEDAVATVTLTNPAKRNAQSSRSVAGVDRGRTGAARRCPRRGAPRRGQVLLRGPRPAGVHPRGVRRRAVLPRHGARPGGRARRDHRRVPGGVHLVAPQRPRVDRDGPGPRHRRRLPARPRLRSADRRRGRAVRHARDQPRPRPRPHGHPPPGLVGYARALEICATGRFVHAEEAERTGLANLVARRTRRCGRRDLAARTGHRDQASSGRPRRSSWTRPPATWPPPWSPPPATAVVETKALLAGALSRDYEEQRTAERAAQGRRLRDLAGITD
ncbi:Enoyl-CoA hydratase/isomerase family protein OS=Streptomyces cyaneofuscatus OX=66883 GN=G3I52_15615 PE=3 SV=1 [Streptomyces cyaneofuscatus]